MTSFFDIAFTFSISIVGWKKDTHTVPFDNKFISSVVGGVTFRIMSISLYSSSFVLTISEFTFLYSLSKKKEASPAPDSTLTVYPALMSSATECGVAATLDSFSSVSFGMAIIIIKYVYRCGS